MKEERQRAILELVRSRGANTQQELAAALAERGFTTTQATISRDIQELGLVRTAGGYRVGQPMPNIAHLVLSVRQVQYTVVIHTPAGDANMVARAIDESAIEGVVGTVAGDDTIIVVLAGSGAAAPLRRFLSG